MYYTHILQCFGTLVLAEFTHILHGYLTGTGVVAMLTHIAVCINE